MTCGPTTTRALADAAGVSEALLFKHFPTKEALFSAMKQTCSGAKKQAEFERLKTLEPGASTLVVMVHFIVSRVLSNNADDDEHTIQNRLMLRSLAEDGEFARLALACTQRRNGGARPLVERTGSRSVEFIESSAERDEKPEPHSLVCVSPLAPWPHTPSPSAPMPRSRQPTFFNRKP